MGRFSSVQAFADNNQAVRQVPYEQAAAKKDDDGFVRPEKVVNPYGSTAGAGSGEFHTYRHGRNRELQRVRQMEAGAARVAADEKFKREKEENKQWEEERTAKRRKKRERQKEAKRRKQNLAKAGIDMSTGSSEEKQASQEDEFEYVPGSAVAPIVTEEEDAKTSASSSDETSAAQSLPSVEICNDGSFLATMKRKLEEASVANTEHTEAT